MFLSRVDRNTEVKLVQSWLEDYVAWILIWEHLDSAHLLIEYGMVPWLMDFDRVNIGYVRAQYQHNIKDSYTHYVAERLQILNLPVY